MSNMLFAEKTVCLNRIVGSDIIRFVVDAPLQFVGLVNGPNVYRQTQIVALLNPFGVLLHCAKIVVNTCVAILLALLGSEVAIQVCNFSLLGRILYHLVAYVLAECNVLYVLCHLLALNLIENLFYHSCLTFGSVVALNLDDEFGLCVFLCLQQILL